MNKPLYFLLLILAFPGLLLMADDALLKYDDTMNARIDTLQKITAMLHHGIRDTAYPGFVFLTAREGCVFYQETGGHFTYGPSSPLMEKSTIFDMASLTKVIATTSAAMVLYDQGKLDLYGKVSAVLPEFAAGGKENVTFWHLLTHSSGLPAWDPLFKNKENPAQINTPEQMVEKLFTLPQMQPEGEKSVYSCMGFITLGKAIEKISGKPLHQFVSEEIFGPLKMAHTFYNPDKKYYSQTAPTEIDSSRGGLLQGKVHDENAYYLNGISGNAGLFSTVEDLAIFCQMMLNRGTYNGTRIFAPETVELFTRTHSVGEDQSRGLGWQKPTGDNSAGKFFSPSSFGHTGFTGTALWIDPEKQLFGIFLTNRVHPSRKHQNLYNFRSKIFDQLQHSIN
ncbi:MAG: serine hydrolase [Candidatus Marinimicrobia bacterium]|nr:serine hydrolase [Candidatus Neomarinimicrobiota bacterium]